MLRLPWTPNIHGPPLLWFLQWYLLRVHHRNQICRHKHRWVDWVVFFFFSLFFNWFLQRNVSERICIFLISKQRYTGNCICIYFTHWRLARNFIRPVLACCRAVEGVFAKFAAAQGLTFEHLTCWTAVHSNQRDKSNNRGERSFSKPKLILQIFLHFDVTGQAPWARPTFFCKDVASTLGCRDFIIKHHESFASKTTRTVTFTIFHIWLRVHGRAETTDATVF